MKMDSSKVQNVVGNFRENMGIELRYDMNHVDVNRSRSNVLSERCLLSRIDVVLGSLA